MSHRWTNDDDLLVIDLYLRHGALPVERSEVRTLARLVGTTRSSIATALANVLYLDTGRGLANYAEHMRVMWERWGDHPEEVAVAAQAIRRRIEDEARGAPIEATAEQRARVAARMEARRRDRQR